MNTRRVLIVLAIASLLMAALACSVSPSISKTTGKMEFTAKKTTIEQGGCVNIFWEVEGGVNVKLNNEAVKPAGTRYVCPDAATTFVLSADFGDDTEIRKITIQVNKKAASSPNQSQAKVSIELWADRTTITKRECTVIHWRTSGGPVRINKIGVDASGDSESCPKETKEYELVVGDNLGSKRIVINVQEGASQPQQPAPQQQQAPVNNPNTQT